MIPKTVKIAGITYKIKEVEDLSEQTDNIGQIFYNRGLIQLDSKLNRDRKEQVFIHEVLHGCFHEAGIEDQDEDVINRVGIVLYQVLKENNLTFGRNDTSKPAMLPIDAQLEKISKEIMDKMKVRVPKLYP